VKEMSEATLKLLNEDGKTTPLSLGARPISEYTDYYNIPILYLSGNAAGMTKDNKVTLNYIFKDYAGTCTLKWQGSSSSKLPKKNYIIIYPRFKFTYLFKSSIISSI
jgi:hypothetical protein